MDEAEISDVYCLFKAERIGAMRQNETDYAGEAKVWSKSKSFARELGGRIAQFRERRGWNRVDLAQRLGVSRDRLGKWELGKHPPPVEMLAALREALGVSIDELVTGEATVQGRLTSQQYEDLGLLFEAVRKVLHEPGSVSLPGGEARKTSS
jgi:transcriptional regulator with XRE-family HTH domain